MTTNLNRGATGAQLSAELKRRVVFRLFSFGV